MFVLSCSSQSYYNRKRNTFKINSVATTIYWFWFDMIWMYIGACAHCMFHMSSTMCWIRFYHWRWWNGEYLIRYITINNRCNIVMVFWCLFCLQTESDQNDPKVIRPNQQLERVGSTRILRCGLFQTWSWVRVTDRFVRSSVEELQGNENFTVGHFYFKKTSLLGRCVYLLLLFIIHWFINDIFINYIIRINILRYHAKN